MFIITNDSMYYIVIISYTFISIILIYMLEYDIHIKIPSNLYIIHNLCHIP